jgi:hypothetical protein
MDYEVCQRRVGGNVRLCSKHIGLYRALDRCHVVNINLWWSLGCGRLKLLVETYIIIRILLPDPCVIKISQLHKCRVSLWTLNGYQQHLDGKLG